MADWSALVEAARRDVGLSHVELWFRYFALGGMSTPLQVEAYFYSALEPTRHDRDLIATALHDRFAELGRQSPLRYIGDDSNIWSP